MTRKKPSPSPFDTTFFRGMYDYKELIEWIVREQYAPAECYQLFPLCITAENCEQVFQLIARCLNVRYLVMLQQFVALVTDEDLENEKEFPQNRHYLLDGAVDPAYIEGIRAVRDYVARHGSLEQFGTK